MDWFDRVFLITLLQFYDIVYKNLIQNESFANIKITIQFNTDVQNPVIAEVLSMN